MAVLDYVKPSNSISKYEYRNREKNSHPYEEFMRRSKLGVCVGNILKAEIFSGIQMGCGKEGC